MSLKIGILAERTGTNAPTIRYYECIGLLPRLHRRDGGQRTYGEADVKRLTFIRLCHDFGCSIEKVRTLVGLTRDPARPCTEAHDLAQEQLATVRAKLLELNALERSLFSFVISCDTSCAGGPGPDCVILEDMSAAVEK